MTYVMENGQRKRVKRRERRDLEAYLIARLSGEPVHKERLTVMECFNEWNDHKLQTGQISASTYRNVQYIFDMYFKTGPITQTDQSDSAKRARAFSQRDITATTADDWRGLVQDWIDGGLTSGQWRGARKVVRGLIKYARRRRYIHWRYEDVMDEVELYFQTPEQKDDASETLTTPELYALRRYCLDHWGPYEQCVWLMTYIGARIGEAVALGPDDVDLDRMTVKINRHETIGDKERRQTAHISEAAKTAAGVRTIAVPPAIMERLREIVTHARAAGWEFLFCRDGGRRIRTGATRKRLYAIEDKAGVPHKTPHKLRKTVASILDESGALTEKQIISQMGHVDYKTTADYYIKDRSTVDERAAALDAIPEMGLEPPEKEGTENRTDV